MRGSCRVGMRQPGMKRDKTRLGSKTYHEKNHQKKTPVRLGGCRELRNGLEAERTCCGIYPNKGDGQKQDSNVGLYQVIDASPQRFAFITFKDDQKKSPYGHYLPGN